MTATGTSSHLIELEERYSAHNYKPLDVVLARGEGVWVWDVEGRRYMDFLSAYSAVNQGHCHPRIVAALIEQSQRLTLCSRAFRHDRFGPLCERLAQRLGYDKVLPMNSGAEAVETAIKAARKWGYDRKGVAADQAEIIVFDGNFHGRTTTIVGFSSTPAAKAGFGPFAPGFVRVPYGDADAVERALTPNTAAVLVEPIQGEGGVVVPPAEFLPRLAELCRAQRVLLICDEIQSGLGRAGAWLAHTLEGVRADAVVVGKALGGGLYPISALVADDDVMDVFTYGTHGSTFGGNPLACAAAEAALDVLEDEQLVENSARLGKRLLEGLRRLPKRLVADVRGRGLWAGIQLHPDAGGARRFCEALRGEEILCKETHEHTIRLAPPLVITADQLDWALERIEGVFAAG